MKFYLVIKRILDIIFALMLLFIVLPVIVICAILIKVEDSNGPVFFIQERVGKHNQVFKIYKLRSMKQVREINNHELTDAERMLKVGLIMRKFSLDELPQLFNVIKGDMSFIGPRPLPVVYLPYYTKQECHRHDINPGISGWAQVNGRNHLTWDEKFKYDIDYVKNISFLFDLKIFFLTIKKVLLRSDIGIRGVNVPDESLNEIRKPNRNIV